MKKFTGILLALSLVFSMAACGPKDDGSASSDDAYVIGISQYGEHPSLDNCREGFLLGLEEAGLKEGEDYTIDYQNAGFDDNIAIQIGQSFSSNNVDLMVGIATNSATACFAASEDKNIPVIFTAITDPVKAKLDKGNITGTSDKLPIASQLQLIRDIQPEAKSIGIVYTTSEPNSVSAVAEYEALAPDYGFTIEAIGVTAQAEVTQAVDTLISKGVDCLSNLTDNNVVGVLASTIEKTNEAGIPVYGSEIEQVKKGCLASAGIEYVELGKRTGLMAAKVLTGEASCEDMPFETIEDHETYISTAVSKALGIEIPADIAETAIEVELEA